MDFIGTGSHTDLSAQLLGRDRHGIIHPDIREQGAGQAQTLRVGIGRRGLVYREPLDVFRQARFACGQAGKWILCKVEYIGKYKYAGRKQHALALC